MSAACDQSNHDRSRSADLSPASDLFPRPDLSPDLPAIINRLLSIPSRTRPFLEISKRVRQPGMLAMVRTAPFNVTALIERRRPVCPAVNQISRPDGDHARPPTLAQPPDNSREIPLP